MRLERRLPDLAGLRAPSRARQFLATTLDGVLGDEDMDAAALLVSELVTNAVMHAGTTCEVELALHDRVLRLAVLDRDPRAPVRRLAVSDTSTNGRGLRLLELLATSWGVEPHPDGRPGKQVWCELAVTPRLGAPAPGTVSPPDPGRASPP